WKRAWLRLPAVDHRVVTNGQPRDAFRPSVGWAPAVEFALRIIGDPQAILELKRRSGLVRKNRMIGNRHIAGGEGKAGRHQPQQDSHTILLKTALYPIDRLDYTRLSPISRTERPPRSPPPSTR